MKSIRYAVLGIVLAAVSFATIAAFADAAPSARSSTSPLARDGGGW